MAIFFIVLIAMLVLLIPSIWWFRQPVLWRMLLAYQANEVFNLLKHGAHGPIHVAPGQATLEQLTKTLDLLSDKLRRDRYHEEEEIWIVDHYWQYWNTSDFLNYLNANKSFVSQGGKIHRMFILSDNDLRNPAVQSVLRSQCEIGKLENGKISNGFELWRGNPQVLRSQAQYQAVSKVFQSLPNSTKGFENFDAIQFKYAVYYSSDFSTDYSALGSSTWIFNPEQAEKLDLRSLFQGSIAERIPCEP